MGFDESIKKEVNDDSMGEDYLLVRDKKSGEQRAISQPEHEQFCKNVGDRIDDLGYEIIATATFKTEGRPKEANVLRNREIHPVIILQKLLGMAYRSIDDILDTITDYNLEGQQRAKAKVELKHVLDFMVREKYIKFSNQLYSPLTWDSLIKFLNGLADKAEKSDKPRMIKDLKTLLEMLGDTSFYPPEVQKILKERD